jgi:D-3-phosphoglycerate dehydrogenase
MKVLVTCPLMLGVMDRFYPTFETYAAQATAPAVVQSLSEEELIELVPQHDGWIIGDDPVTRRVLEAGRAGRLKAAVKWGVGVDNIDFAACKDLGIPITNTPGLFGAEVGDTAMGYVIALARESFQIDRGVHQGGWPKPTGISLAGKTAALVGFGDIGKNTAARLLASGLKVIAYDPFVGQVPQLPNVERAEWPLRLEEADYIVLTCSLTPSSRKIVNADSLSLAKQGVRLVNVSRGQVIDQTALATSLASGKVYSAALDVFEVEPLEMDSPLREHPRVVFGSHNASNTIEAVTRGSETAIRKLMQFLGLAPVGGND